MAQFGLPLSKLIHENFSIVMNFAFARRPLERLLETSFQGEWKYLRKALFEIPERNAAKACVELAMFLRFLDDEEGLSKYISATDNTPFGRLNTRDGQEKQLSLRDVANKIIHASTLEWDLSVDQRPVLICNSQQSQNWLRAEIDLVSLASFCGRLMS